MANGRKRGGVISGCVNYATVTGTDAKGTGGIVGAGWNKGKIHNCYNVGTITGSWPAGGIAGSSEANISNCYNVGYVSSDAGSDKGMALATNNGGGGLTNCYYLEGSSSSNFGYYSDGNDNGSNKMSAAQMKDASFVKKLGSAYTADNAKNPKNQGYPLFSWQLSKQIEQPDNPVVEEDLETEEEEQEDPADEEVSVEVEPEVSVEGEEASSEVDGEFLDEALAQAKEQQADKLVVQSTTEEDVKSSTVTVTQESTGKVTDAGLALEIQTNNGTLNIPAAAVGNLKNDLTVTFTENDNGSTTISVRDGDQDASLGTSAKVILPVKATEANPVTDGSVLCIVHEDGTEEILPYSSVSQIQAAAYIDGSVTLKIKDNSKSFSDVSGESWYSSAVSFATAHEMFEGTGNGQFDPQGTMTRGMIVQVLKNIEKGESETDGIFSDVEDGAWYAEAVAWASENGIVNDAGNGTFGANDSVTREQMAVILYRYVQTMDYSVKGNGDLSAFHDADGISSWAGDAMSWAVGAGILNGTENEMLNPGSSASRAEMAQIMQNFTKVLLGA